MKRNSLNCEIVGILFVENQKNYNLVFVIRERMNELMCKCKTLISR